MSHTHAGPVRQEEAKPVESHEHKPELKYDVKQLNDGNYDDSNA